jgi:hypothetical protein
MTEHRPNQWPMLFDISAKILEHAQDTLGFTVEWSFGGGTALMLRIDHRESHDIDLFLDDPQLTSIPQPRDAGNST